MFPLFELVRLFTVKDDSDFRNSPTIVRYAYKEAGEINLLALACTNGYVLLRYSSGNGKPPSTHQLPWPQEKPISSMCFDPTVTWLLVLAEDATLFIVPALSIMDPSAKVNQLWREDDVTITKVKRPKGIPTVVLWWHTLDDQQVAIIGTKIGEIIFVDLLTRKTLNEIKFDCKIMQIDIVEDDQQMMTNLLITDQSGVQWKLLLESRTHEILSLPDKELLDLGYNTVDGRNLPIISITSPSEQTADLFLPLRFYQFQRSVFLSPQYAKGRHFVAAHCDKTTTYQIYDSDVEHNPLFVYKLPFGAYNVILTDKVIFSTTRLGGEKRLLVIANQRAETSVDDQQDFNKDAVLQQFDLPQEEHLLTVLKKSYPFYWHDKREEDLCQKMAQDIQLGLGRANRSGPNILPSTAYDMQVTSHTVLNGCIIITGSSVYECRPRISPERLFLQMAVQQLDHSRTEVLGIGLGLDLNTLYEVSAEHVLKNKDFTQAIRLYKLSKCSHARRVAIFAQYGCVQEVLTYARQVLCAQNQDINTVERKQLTDLAIHCFVHQIQEHSGDKTQLQQSFLEFLITNFSYEETVALSLLSENGLIYVLLELAKARGLVMEALDLLAKNGYTRLDNPVVDSLVSKGFINHLVQAASGTFFQTLTPQYRTEILCSKPQLALQHYNMIQDCVADLSVNTLESLANIFDPSRASLRSHISKHMLSKKRTSSMSSLNSQCSDGEPGPMENTLPEPSKLVEFFVTLVLHLNSRRDKSGDIPSAEEVLTMNSNEVSKQSPEETSHTKVRKLSCRPMPVGAGHQHVALVRNGDLYTWGRTSHGRLGHGDLAPENTVSPPCRVETLHMLQVRVISVACGGEHTLALTQQGVFAWGSSQYGQIGIGTRHIYSRPMQLDKLSSLQCVSVESGQYHSLAVTADGEVYSWGWGVHGQLGHGGIEDALVPTHVQALSDKQIIKVCGGYCHTLALSSLGEVYSFGCGFFGQLGLEMNKKQTLPVRIHALKEKVVIVSTKFFHNVAVTHSNHVYSWGCHPYNLRFAAHSIRKARQAGAVVGDPVDHFLLPELVDTSFVHGRIKQAVCGSSHSVLVTLDGDVYTWGRNMDGQIGNNTRQDMKIPSMVTNINDRNVIHITSGGDFNIGQDSDGLVWGWGKNDVGQIKQDKQEPSLSSTTHKVIKTHNRRRAGSGLTEFLLPTVCPGLPNSKPSSSLWRPSHFTRSGSYDSSDGETWWTEENQEDVQLDLLPDLQSLGNRSYGRITIHEVLQHLSELCNCMKIMRQCVNLDDWLSAAYVCLHQNNFAQALAYHLKALTAYSAVFGPDFLQSTMKVVQHYISLCISQELPASQKEENYRLILIQILEHWEKHDLSVSSLEALLNDHMDNLCCILSTFLFWKNPKTEKDGETMATPVCLGLTGQFMMHFTTKFCLQVLQKVFDKMLLVDFEKRYPVSHGSLKRLLTCRVGSSDSDLDLQSGDKLIPFDQLWQDVVQNLQKGSESRDYIYITRTDIDHMAEKIEQTQGQQSLSEEVNSQEPNAVLFTCGHHYTRRNFMDEVMVKFNKELSQGPASLPGSASLLMQYYCRQGLLPLACPKCVLNTLHTAL